MSTKNRAHEELISWCSATEIIQLDCSQHSDMNPNIKLYF